MKLSRDSDWTGWLIVAALVAIVTALTILAFISTSSTEASARAATPAALLMSHVDERVADASTFSRGEPRGPVPTPSPPSGSSDRATPTHSPGDSGTEQPAVDDEPTVTSSQQPQSSGEADTGSLSPGDIPEPWHSLAMCETGGTMNPHIVSSGGTYHGLFQFSLSTWAAVGGSGYPSDASVAEQLARAQKLQRIAGWDQWPTCAAQLGLY